MRTRTVPQWGWLAGWLARPLGPAVWDGVGAGDAGTAGLHAWLAAARAACFAPAAAAPSTTTAARPPPAGTLFLDEGVVAGWLAPLPKLLWELGGGAPESSAAALALMLDAARFAPTGTWALGPVMTYVHAILTFPRLF